MLNHLRQTAPAVALLICVALLATWLTGAHGHRHVDGQEHGQTLHALTGMDSDHEQSHDPDVAQAIAADLTRSEDHDGEYFDPHSVSLIHEDGHENIELQALQPPAVKSLLDLQLLALFCVAVLVLTRTRAPLIAVLTDPPDPKRADWSLRPPLRGPPSFSVV